MRRQLYALLRGRIGYGSVALIIVVSMVLLFTACGDGSAGRSSSLTVYSAGPRPLAEAVCATFTAKTGIPVNLFTATTGQVMARLEAERYRPQADVVVFASEIAAEAMKQDGRLLRLNPQWLEYSNADWNDPDNHYWGTSAAMVGVALRLDSPEVPDTWKGFFDGGFPGRMVLPSPSRSGAAGDFILAYTLFRGEEAWPEYEHARASGMDIAAANSQAIGGLRIGAYQAIIGAVDYLIYRQIAAGAPFRMYYPEEGAALVVRPIAVMRSTDRTDAAELFVAHYFSSEVQAMVAAEHLLPARSDISPSETRMQCGKINILPNNPAKALANQRRIMRRFQLEVERAPVIRR